MSDRLFHSLGFHWDRLAVPTDVPLHSTARACFHFHKALAEFVWNAGRLAGNQFTFPEVQTLLCGITVGGRTVDDQAQILNIAECAKRLSAMVKTGQFLLSKSVFAELNRIVSCGTSLECGVFRGEGQEKEQTPTVSLGEHGFYSPLLTGPDALKLEEVFRDGCVALEACPPFERALAFFLFGASQLFFFDGNKQTAFFMMNGILMSHGIDAISVPAIKAQEFTQKMVRFYLSKDATEMMVFLADHHPTCYSPR
jgi:hypothetical protein